MFIPAREFPQRTGSVGSSNGFVLSQNKELCSCELLWLGEGKTAGQGENKQGQAELHSRELIYVCAVNPCGIYCPH